MVFYTALENESVESTLGFVVHTLQILSDFGTLQSIWLWFISEFQSFCGSKWYLWGSVIVLL